jgi:hypothetical protein
MRSFVPAAVVVLLCLAAVPIVRAQTNFAFAVDRNANLYRVDLDHASVTLVGITGVFLEGLALSPDGRLFGTDTGGNLYQVNVNSGAATLVGNTGGGDVEGLHFFGSMLVGVGLTTAPPVFLSINTQTGASTTLVTANSTTGPVRAMTSSDLNHALVAGAQGAFQHALYSVDLVTGDVTLIGIPNVGTTFLAAMDFNRAGTLYALDANGNEWTVNPCTAAVTLVGNTGSIFWLDMAASSSHSRKSC